MRTYVSTLGFHETRVNRPLLRHGLENDDVVVLVRPASEQDTDRGSDAVDYVEDMLHEIAPGADVLVERIDGSEFETAVLRCSQILRGARGELVVNFGGGAREIFLPLAIATVLHSNLVDTALQYTDVDQSVREWPVPNLAASLPENARPTLHVIHDSGPNVAIPDLDERMEPSKSTISRHVADLEAEGLVETEMRGKTKYVSATLTGRLKIAAMTGEG